MKDATYGHLLYTSDAKEDLATLRSGQEPWLALALWYDMHDLPEQQQRVGTNRAELEAFLRQYGNGVRAEIAKGNLAAVVDLCSIISSTGPFDLIGIRSQEVVAWLEAYARQLYAGMATHPENAARILTLPCLQDSDLVHLFGNKGCRHLTKVVIPWALQVYVYMQQPALDPEQVIKSGGRLLRRMVFERYVREVMFPGARLVIYPQLGFTVDEVKELYFNLLRKSR